MAPAKQSNWGIVWNPKTGTLFPTNDLENIPEGAILVDPERYFNYFGGNINQRLKSMRGFALIPRVETHKETPKPKRRFLMIDDHINEKLLKYTTGKEYRICLFIWRHSKGWGNHWTNTRIYGQTFLGYMSQQLKIDRGNISRHIDRLIYLNIVVKTTKYGIRRLRINERVEQYINPEKFCQNNKSILLKQQIEIKKKACESLQEAKAETSQKRVNNHTIKKRSMVKERTIKNRFSNGMENGKVFKKEDEVQKAKDGFFNVKDGEVSERMVDYHHAIELVKEWNVTDWDNLLKKYGQRLFTQEALKLEGNPKDTKNKGKVFRYRLGKQKEFNKDKPLSSFDPEGFDSSGHNTEMDKKYKPLSLLEAHINQGTKIEPELLKQIRAVNPNAIIPKELLPS